VPHNLWNAGDEDLLVFWLVAPNFVNNRWRTDSFPPGAMDLRAVRSHVDSGVDLPGDDKIRSQVITLNPSSSGLSFHTAEQQEAVIYLIEGQADVKVGKLAGRLAAHDFVHVPVGTAYSVTAADGPALVLRFEMPGD
jgi:quercetin dioxygenase-like cupin family protein